MQARRRLTLCVLAILTVSAAPWVVDRIPATLAAQHDIERGEAQFVANLHVADACVFWANSTTTKDAFKIVGNSHLFEGCLHSNNDMVVGGGANEFNRTLRYTTTFSTNNNDHTFRAGIVRVNATPYPYPFAIADYAPGGRRANEADAAGKYYLHAGGVILSASLLRDGLHYVDGSAVVSPGSHRANVTIVATGSIRITSAGPDLSAYTDGLLAFSRATGTNAILTDASACRLVGALYADRGEMHFAGSDCTYEGQIVGDAVKIAGERSRLVARTPRVIAAPPESLASPIATQGSTSITRGTPTSLPHPILPEAPPAPRHEEVLLVGVSLGDFDGGGRRDVAVGAQALGGAFVLVTTEQLPLLP